MTHFLDPRRDGYTLCGWNDYERMRRSELITKDRRLVTCRDCKSDRSWPSAPPRGAQGGGCVDDGRCPHGGVVCGDDACRAGKSRGAQGGEG